MQCTSLKNQSLVVTKKLKVKENTPETILHLKGEAKGSAVHQRGYLRASEGGNFFLYFFFIEHPQRQFG